MERFRVGDLVSVPGFGDGHICEIRTFKAKIKMMTSEDAGLFGRDVAARFGSNGHETWAEVMVASGNRVRWFESSEVRRR